MLETIIKGLLIGILVSVPMGPIGVLCVQRTLREGRFYGFVTGIGATFSDLVYAVISLLGVRFVMEFIELHQYPLQVGGSILLLIVAYFIYKSNPTKKLMTQQVIPNSYWKSFISSFFLNLSNISILFIFIGLFAQFNFIKPSEPHQSIVGLLSIGVGTILWWFCISTAVDRMRVKFNPRGLKVFNTILGATLVIIAVVLLISGICHMTNLS